LKELFWVTVAGRRPVVTFTDYVKLGKVIVVSSNYMKVAWATKLFSRANILMDQPFMVVNKANEPNVS
jgi:hypothetical protein